MDWWMLLLWVLFVALFSAWVGGAMAAGDLLWFKPKRGKHR